MPNQLQIPVLYNPDRRIASLLKSQYEIRPNLRVDPSRLHSTYLAIIELEGQEVHVQFYRVIGRKDEKAIATPHHIEDVNDLFVNEFTNVLIKNHILSEVIDVPPQPESIVEETAPVPEYRSTPSQTHDFFQTDEPDPLFDKSPVKVQAAPPAKVQQPVEVQPPAKPVANIKKLKMPESKSPRKSLLDSLGIGDFLRKRSSSKVFFVGASAIEVIQAQTRIKDVLTRAGITKVMFEEVVTPTNLMQRIEKESNYLIVTDIEKIQSDPGWREAYQSLIRMGCRIVDVTTILTKDTDESILVHFQDMPNIDIKAVLYTRQRRVMFINNTGGVGKTTLSLNLGYWLASRNATTMYMEILGGSGIDDILGIQSAMLENMLYGVEQMKQSKIKGVSLYFSGLSDTTNSIIGDMGAWQRFFENVVLDQEATPYLHALLIDTYTNMLSTRYLVPYMTDIMVVSDMRQTTAAMTINTMRNIMDMLPSNAPGKTGPNIAVIHNQYPLNDRDAEIRLGRITGDLDDIVESRHIKLSHLVVPADSACYGSIRIYDESQRVHLIGGIVEQMYGVKIAN